ncbi:MAG: hypothetical protein COS25_02630 [Candidatus Nealsonbacteria bacterium CG02_land_8_20_14_3_00_37_10]|uniref:Uncharacterized protein n=2 Tax=Candidatus Nealsoniibacteriota TaxID=1817911 RepID=A0A2G9YYB8_9BACT|nr:MAG: hypothetical protein COX35_01745 [Candidatus Nealsonbacteria bacterium CG23_combo_of_CG06-09_8_20_14_all_37_18]PIV44914.1 MAG: hypothetical protein COS25_02630 [Candidatus Nealsonbacteria bacterium CG02_land_8_20_14_3_00_37_10]
MGGTRATISLPARKKFLAKPKRGRGGKEKGFREKEFPPRPSVIFRNRRRDFLGKKSELFPINTTLDDLSHPRPSLRSGLGLRRAENNKTKFFKLSV